MKQSPTNLNKRLVIFVGTETWLLKIPPVVPTDMASGWTVVSTVCVYVQYVLLIDNTS